jgi:DNA replicative helicase MCM subunit Mcm2 (Cdc46/Mcm family)
LERESRITEKRTSYSLASSDSREAKKIRAALGIFKQLEDESQSQLVDEREFLNALKNVGLDDRATREAFDVLRNAGQIYEVRPSQYRSIL